MCTAINYKTGDHYFGRNLDLEYHYQEEVVVTPRNYRFSFRQVDAPMNCYAMIGTATVVDNYPLYYEATNEHGLCMAGLNFPGNAVYNPENQDRDNIAPFELIPWILSSCKNIAEAKYKLARLNIADIPFNDNFPNTPLHWLLSYKTYSIVIEQTNEGLMIYDNPFGVLTNNPPFPYQVDHLSTFQHLSASDPINRFAAAFDFPLFSRGMGAIGLTGDWSSPSRFVRAAFVKANSITAEYEYSSVSQFFHLLNTVAMPRGSIMVDGKPEITLYSSCCNTDKGIYYYTTYDNSQITAVSMHNTDLTSSELHRFPHIATPSIRLVN